jgi:predicted acetyltransferase
MPITYRNINDETFTEWRIAVRRGFNEHVHLDDVERLKRDRVEMDRIFGAFDGDEVVGTGGADSHMLTVPGGEQVPISGIAYMTTSATHRRRGVLTGMVERVLADAREREEPLAALWAEESAIYGRFGFGMASYSESWTIESRFGAYARPVSSPGSVGFVTPDEATEKFPEVYDRVRQTRTGFVDRSPSRWRYNFFDEERVRGGWSAFFYVAYESSGRVDGYAVYRTKTRAAFEGIDVAIQECVAATDEAHAALWRFLLDIDLVQIVTAEARPADDLLWWLLADPRRLRRRVDDGLWIHLIDPARALSARSYGDTGRLVIEVDRAHAAGGGSLTFALEGSPQGASCHPTGESPDLAMTDSEIGAIYLGGVRPSDLARAGRIEERRGDALALALADRMFPTSPAPWCAHHF